MINQMACFLLGILEKHYRIQSEKREVYLYGMNQLLFTLLSTMCLILIGFFWNKPMECLVVIAVYYINQTIGGGVHASTHFRCFCITTLFVTSSLALISFPVPDGVMYSLSATSAVLLLFFPLTLHQNKRYLENRSKYFIRRSRSFAILELALATVLILIRCESLFYACCAGMIISAISRMLAVFAERFSISNRTSA